MIGARDVIQAITGVWLLFLDRRDALKFFDASVAGFWKSFQAILLIAPIYALSVLADEPVIAADAAAAGVAFDAATYFSAHAVSLALDWVTLPLLLAVLAPMLGIRDRYAAYIVVRNWASVVTIVPLTLVSLLGLTGLFPGELILVPAGAALAISLRISYLTARRTLRVPVDLAIAYVVLDFLVSLGVQRTIAYLFGLPA